MANVWILVEEQHTTANGHKELLAWYPHGWYPDSEPGKERATSQARLEREAYREHNLLPVYSVGTHIGEKESRFWVTERDGGSRVWVVKLVPKG